MHDAAVDADTVCQFAHILVVNLSGPEVLTDLEGEIIRQSRVDLGALDILAYLKEGDSYGAKQGQAPA